jgi:hypothetical protein
VDHVPGSSAALAAIASTGATAAAAALGFPKGVWIATLVLSVGLGVIAVVRFRDERAASVPDRVEALREAHRKGASLREGLVWTEGVPRSHGESAERQRRAKRKARDWAEETWLMLRHQFPADEAEFYGPGSRALGRTGFWLSADEEMNTHSADWYLERKLQFLATLLRRYDGGAGMLPPAANDDAAMTNGLTKVVQHELVAAIEDGEALAPGFRDVDPLLRVATKDSRVRGDGAGLCRAPTL